MKPLREHATNNSQTYFVTSRTWESRHLFRAEPWARLFFRTLLSHRGEAYLLHEFVLMPDHFHVLITPSIALERAIQLVKGGFSFRAKKEFGSNAEIWQRGFSDHRIRDAEDYDKHVHYIHLNPVKQHLCATPAEYQYSSAYPGWKLDPIPQGLKPGAIMERTFGTAEAVPFQNNEAQSDTAGVAPFRSDEGAQLAVLKGHDFSRAVRGNGADRALAPEGGEAMRRSAFFTLVALLSLCGYRGAYAQGIVDCVYPGRVSASRVHGQVFDPFGVVVPDVVVTLVNERGSILQTRTDSRGRFHLAAPRDKYPFKAVFPMLQTSQTELSVGEDLAGLVHPSNLHVILGLNGSYCAWVTTSQKEFRQIISNNTKRSEETTQRNATQK